VEATTAILIAGLALLGVAAVFGAWFLRERRLPLSRAAPRAAGGDGGRGPAFPETAGAAPTSAHPESLNATHRRRSATIAASDRLWRRVFEATATPVSLPNSHQAVRSAVLRTLEAESLGERYFPRRPTLMPQLLHAVNDPEAGPARLAAIVSQDPVLTGDVVRLANSAFYRVTPHPVETIQRAIVVCGSDGLQSLIAAALMQPVFRGTHGVFGRFPSVLWERTSQGAAAAETYALQQGRGDRLLAQLASLLGALGPLVIFRAATEAYAEAPTLKPHPELYIALLAAAGAETSRRIARSWGLPARVVSALGVQAGDARDPDSEPLAEAIEWGELIGTLCALERERVIDAEAASSMALEAGISSEVLGEIWKRLRNARR
jgi:HD-like signal output (HDOD) protein